MLKDNLLSYMMANGNKQTSEKLTLKSLKNIQKTNNKKKSFDIIKIGIINNSPVIYMKNIKRKRKHTIEVPFLLKNSLRIAYGIKFILKSDFQTTSLYFYKKLNKKIVDSSKLSNKSVENINRLYKKAVLKKKFANYRWF